MLRIKTILLFLLFISCKENKQHVKNTTTENQSAEVLVKLPEFENWKELYSDELVKNKFDEYLENGTTILAVYLNNKIAKQKDSLLNMDFDDYALFFVIDKEQKRKIENSDLEKIFYEQTEKSAAEVLDFADVINKALIDSTLIKAEKPYLLFANQNYENVYTAITITKPYKNDHNYIVLNTFNLMNINNHLVYGGYYLNYNGLESFNLVKKNNDIIISKFIKQNEKKP
ncbi:hypothetical protein [uncultured Kordia sp.]|uniref:hypothetical protein n=1 Tax=uncultured Kordia sp. TaxID=507699 RepID=UPI00260FC521|nr:hypothetical protein [uncultured Kordia sp.]